VSETRIKEFEELKSEMKELKARCRKLQSKLNEHERGWVKDFLEELR